MQSGIIESVVQRSLPHQRTLAVPAPVQVLVDGLLFFETQLPVEEKRERLDDRIAAHTKSPNAVRIFCVTRNRQFLAASSVVPSISPMFRRRSPW